MTGGDGRIRTSWAYQPPSQAAELFTPAASTRPKVVPVTVFEPEATSAMQNSCPDPLTVLITTSDFVTRLMLITPADACRSPA